MVGKIADLLGRSQDRLFRLTISDLEKATGQTCVDLQIRNEILLKSKQIFSELGIDLKNATVTEAYQALLTTKKRNIFDGSDFVGVTVGDSIISCNLNDLKSDRQNKVEVKNRSLIYMQEALMNELKKRYLKLKTKSNERQLERLISEL